MKVFLKSIKSKQIVVAGLAVLVAVAGYYRWNVERKGEAVPVMTDGITANSELEQPEKIVETEQSDYEDYFARARYERDCARSEAAELLKVSAQDGEDSSEQLAKNGEKLQMYAKNTEDEASIENMVIAKGYSDCVAFVDEDGVRVVVKSDSLTADGVAQIKDIVVEQTGVKTTAIKISSKE